MMICFFLSSKQVVSQLYTEYTYPDSITSFVQKMFASPNVQISNVTYKGYDLPYNNPDKAIKNIGFFNSKNSTVGIDSGIILTGGFLDPPYGLGRPASIYANYSNFYGRDSLLSSLIAPSFVVGVSVLEFDFVPNGDTVKFNYVFASDEYPDQVCHPDNDVFAFHISGPGINGLKNIATIPGTNIFVGNNSINDTSIMLNKPGNINLCQSVNYPYLYVDHKNDSNFIFSGSTVVMTAKYATVPCAVYHMRFAIGEGGQNGNQNSAVFLEANSFNSEPIKIKSEVTYEGSDTVLYEGCGSAKIIFRRTYNIQQPKTYSLSISGTALNGIDYQSLPSTITMLPGEMYDTLFIVPITDLINDNLETVTLSIGDTLCDGSYYESKIDLVIHEKPNFDIAILPNSGSYCDSVKFSSKISGAIPPLKHNWLNGLGNDSLLYYFPKISASFSEEQITLNVIDGCGSVAYDTVMIVFSKKPKADFIFSPSLLDIMEPIVTFTDISSKDVTSWFWTFDTLSFSQQQNVTYTFSDTGSYFVELLVSNQFNCMDSISKLIRINDASTLYIPNTFTPNGDGLNDYFIVKGNEIKEFEMKIYDRWGNIVFESNSIYNGWSGASCETGVFNFKIFVVFNNDLSEYRYGKVLLMR